MEEAPILITHAGHPLRRISKQIGRCLTVLLKELHCAFAFSGTPSTTGVRDIWPHLQRAPPHEVAFWERDIDNAYWELNKRAVALAVTKAAALVRLHRNMRGGFHVAIAKGSMRLLDRIGTATGRHFRTYTLQEVTYFVNWDLHYNTLFAVWGIVLEQGKRGVPIGGYIIARLMCIWALIQEHTFFEDPAK